MLCICSTGSSQENNHMGTWKSPLHWCQNTSLCSFQMTSKAVCPFSFYIPFSDLNLWCCLKHTRKEKPCLITNWKILLIVLELGWSIHFTLKHLHPGAFSTFFFVRQQLLHKDHLSFWLILVLFFITTRDRFLHPTCIDAIFSVGVKIIQLTPMSGSLIR